MEIWPWMRPGMDRRSWPELGDSPGEKMPIEADAGIEPMASLNVTSKVSPEAMIPLPFPLTMAIGPGAAPSNGGKAKKDAWFPAASAMPPGVAARAILKLPIEVSGAPSPSVRVSTALLPETETELRVPPEGTPVRVHGELPAVYAASV